MIRVFELLCKLNLNISAENFFIQAMSELNISEHSCPYCHTKHPDWIKHASYDRYLISFENGKTITYCISVVRYRCPSCGHTHAILPESIIPYKSYSFLFIIAVMRDYFTKCITVEAICQKYDIAMSTLYSWKKLFLKHKKIWLGVLNNISISAMDFLKAFIPNESLNKLKEFFLTAGASFLQGNTANFNPE